MTIREEQKVCASDMAMLVALTGAAITGMLANPNGCWEDANELGEAAAWIAVDALESIKARVKGEK